MYDYSYEALGEVSSSPSQESTTVVLGFGEEVGTEYRAARENPPGWWLCSMSWQAWGLHTHTHTFANTHDRVSLGCTSALIFTSILKWGPVVSLVTTCPHTKLFQHYSTFLTLHVTFRGFSFNNLHLLIPFIYSTLHLLPFWQPHICSLYLWVYFHSVLFFRFYT